MEIRNNTVKTSLGDVEVYRLVNESGAWVELSSLGAGIIGLGVPDAEGRIENVALGYENIECYIGDGPNMGKTLGRYANRIGRGILPVGDKTYQLNLNLPPHHLHGGAEGLMNQIWDSEMIKDGVVFRHVSPDGTENYPGTLQLSVTYRWSEDNRLTIDYLAETDRPTALNLSNHAYWNLRGAGSGTALGHEVRMQASRYLETDDKLLPTGKLRDVTDTPMDFSEFKTLERDMNADFEPLKIGKGYDHCWAIDGWKPGKMSSGAVVVRDPVSRRTLTIDSDQPGMQLYTGNWLTGSPSGRDGADYKDYEGVAIEMQGFPDAPNRPEFPSQLLLPGEVYERRIVYAFGLY